MPWIPTEPDEVPTLGYQVADWIEDLLSAPDRGEDEDFVLYPEQLEFVLRFYELDPVTGKRRRRRGVISRPRGWGKSPFLAAIALAEALGPVVPAGWDANGQPVGQPWARIRTPLVQIAAVSEDQTKNTWSPLLEMCGPRLLDEYPRLEPLDTFVNLPRGRIEPITSSARTVKGNRAVFAVLDQTEEWVRSNNGLRLASVMRINAAKVGGSTIESPNAFTPGEGSVAEESAAFWAQIREGRARDDGLFYDHREAPAETDLGDAESLKAGLAYAYGDSAAPNGGHVDLDVIAATIWDPATDPQVARADFLNQITHAADAWVTQYEWNARRTRDVGGNPVDLDVEPHEPITLGFDGSRKRARGVTDATALVACRVADGYTWAVQVWEQPEGDDDWRVPVELVDETVRATFKQHHVVGFYADPAKWESYIATWERDFGARLTVKASKQNPIEWWMTGGRSSLIVQATEQAHTAIVEGEMSHGGLYDAVLGRHVINARRRAGRSGIQLGKDFPTSPRKIDAAIAYVLAYQARLDALAAGVKDSRPSRAPRRLR